MNPTRFSSRLLALAVCAAAALSAWTALPARALTESQQDAAIASLQSAVASLQSTVSSQQATISTLTAKLQYVSVSGTDMTISGANLHVVSGSGKTNGAVNGLGNVIIGYDEARTGSGAVNTRTGSHNLILGLGNNFSSYGGLVAGASNTASGGFASVTGGAGNTASGMYAAVSGGRNNAASATYATVGGGDGNAASVNDSFLPLDTQVVNINTQIAAIQSTASTQGGSITSLQTSVAGATAITRLFSLSTDATRSDGKANTELTLTGVNLHIVNGLGATNGEPGSPYDTASPVVNGLGNLIIGYDELRANDPNNSTSDVRTGSHNLIVGDENNYSSYGGIVAGELDTISAPFASVTGGGNMASGRCASVTGGGGNTASSDFASVSGGEDNTASGEGSSVSGGFVSIASDYCSSVSGGQGNTAGGNFATVSGGDLGSASGVNSSVSGGNENTASGDYSSVSGGQSNMASGVNSSVTGGYTNVAGGNNSSGNGDETSVSGGENNIATGENSSVSGGNSVTEANTNGWAAGSLHSP